MTVYINKLSLVFQWSEPSLSSISSLINGTGSVKIFKDTDIIVDTIFIRHVAGFVGVGIRCL